MVRKTKDFYLQGENLYEEILNHPDFGLGRREIEALKRFLPAAGNYSPKKINIIHLGIGNGREIPVFMRNFNIGTYIINDISLPTLEKAVTKAKDKFPKIKFKGVYADIEQPGVISFIRQGLKGSCLIVLVGNSVIFSNHKLDQEIVKAMRSGDRFLLTVESPYDQMYYSYKIEPVYKLLSQSGILVNKNNTKAWYDKYDQCLKMERQGRILLSAYKPTLIQFKERLQKDGMTGVNIMEYKDIHMLAGLFRKS